MLDYKVEKKAFQNFFNKVLIERTDACWERDVARGCKATLLKEWVRLASGGEATLQSIHDRDLEEGLQDQIDLANKRERDMLGEDEQ